MSVIPQYKLVYGECDSLIVKNLSLTGRIQSHDVPRPRRSQASKTRDMGSHQDMVEHRLPPLVLGHKIAQVFPARPGSYAVKYAAADSESLAKEFCTLTLRTVYPAPRGSISHF